MPEQHGKPYSHTGRFYIREGASSQQMAREEIREFFFREGLIRLDESPCRSFDPEVEITPERWSTFSSRAGVSGDLDPMTVLGKPPPSKGRYGDPCRAWLLADDITRFTLTAGVTCAVFRGSSKTHILDRKEFTGSVYDIYESVMGLSSGQAQLGSHPACPRTRRAAGAA